MPRSLWHGSAVTRLLGLWVQISPQAWMFVSCEWRVLLGWGPFWVNHSSRVLPNVVCSVRVIAKPRKGTTWPQSGVKAPQEKNVTYVHQSLVLSPTCAPAKVDINKKSVIFPQDLKKFK